MPITVNVPWDGVSVNMLGPGARISLSSDFIGPLPTGSFFQVIVSTDNEGKFWVFQEQFPTATPQGSFQLMSDAHKLVHTQDVVVNPGTTVYAVVTLNSPTAELDSGISLAAQYSQQMQYDQALTLASQVQMPDVSLLPQIDTTTQTTLGQTTQILPQTTTIQTDTQNMVNTLFPQLADMLNTIMGGITSTITGIGGAVSKTIGEIFSGRTLDLLTTYDFGTKCAPDAFDEELGGGDFYGIQMECTTLADWYTFTGPGDSYTIQSLGTLEIYRGGNLILRQGLHSTTHMVYPLPGIPTVTLELDVPVVPPEYQVVLVPAPETCWHLVGLLLP